MGKVYNIKSKLLEPLIQAVVEKSKQYQENLIRASFTRYERAIANLQLAPRRGDQNIKKCEDMFYNGFGLRYTPIQEKIFRAIVNAMLPKIYGDDWELVKEDVLFHRQVEHFKQELLILMARRNGKTFVVAASAAALLLTIPGITIGIFSRTERQSKMLMREIKKRVKDARALGYITDQDFTNGHDNVDSLMLQMTATGTEQEVGSFPGSSKVLLIFHRSSIKAKQLNMFNWSGRKDCYVHPISLVKRKIFSESFVLKFVVEEGRLVPCPESQNFFPNLLPKHAPSAQTCVTSIRLKYLRNEFDTKTNIIVKDLFSETLLIPCPANYNGKLGPKEQIIYLPELELDKLLLFAGYEDVLFTPSLWEPKNANNEGISIPTNLYLAEHPLVCLIFSGSIDVNVSESEMTKQLIDDKLYYWLSENLLTRLKTYINNKIFPLIEYTSFENTNLICDMRVENANKCIILVLTVDYISTNKQ